MERTPITNNRFEQEQCAICWDKFSTPVDVLTLKCQHIFHKACILQWFEKNHNDCPVCREVVRGPFLSERIAPLAPLVKTAAAGFAVAGATAFVVGGMVLEILRPATGYDVTVNVLLISSSLGGIVGAGVASWNSRE